MRLSFFGYKHKNIKPLIKTEFFNIAEIEDIACMKLSAIVSRSFLILKSLIYFDDIKSEPLIFKKDHNVSLNEIKKYFEDLVTDYFKQ